MRDLRGASPVVLLAAVVMSATAVADMTPKPAPQALRLVRAGQVHDLGGFLGARYRAQIAALLAADPPAWVPTVDADGQGHRWYSSGVADLGKWLAAAVLGAQTSGNPRLAKYARQALQQLKAAQEESGYLSCCPPADRHPAGHPVAGTGDAYNDYFLLHGLLTYSDETGDPLALEVARHLADFWVQTVGPGRLEFIPLPIPESIAGLPQHLGMEGTLLFDPVLRLYEHTGDPRYLAWCEWVLGNMDRCAGVPILANLKRAGAGALPLNQYKPHPHAHTTQMHLRGLLRLYCAGADDGMLQVVRGVWRQIAEQRMFITGGVSVDEVYPPAGELPNSGSIAETCASASWLLLSAELLQATGEARYADVLERVVFNHLPAAQTPDGTTFKYYTPLNGAKPIGYFRAPDCCNSSGPWALAELPRLIYGQSADDVWVSLYVASRLEARLPDGTGLTIEQRTSFPEEGEVTLSVSPAKEAAFGLRVRIPGWCHGATVSVNGTDAGPARPGEYLALRRSWRPGDTVRLSLPMALRWVEGEHTNRGLRCLTRGPVVYCLDTLLASDETRAAARGRGRRQELPGLVRVVLDPSRPKTARVDTATPYLGPAYEARAGVMGLGLRPVVLWPFANVGCWYLRPEDRSVPNAPSYPYATWVPAGDERLERFRAVDEVVIGDPESELAHRLRGEATEAGPPESVTFRHSPGGWFSYRVGVAPTGPCALLVEYWGGDTERRFDLLVDGAVVATEDLERPAPGRFFRKLYDVPAGLTVGKAAVEVRFRSAPGSVAGGVFGLCSGTVGAREGEGGGGR